MKSADRNKAARLEGIMARFAAAEQRALSDLRTAGFTFHTVEAAKRRLVAQRTLSGFTQAQIDIAVRAMENRGRKS